MALKEKIMMSCEQATALVEKKRDKKLALSERMGLWAHLGYCSLCALFFKQSRILDDSAHAYATRVTNEQKGYKLDPARKAAIHEALDIELKR